MSSRRHTWAGYSGPAPLAPYPAHAAPLDGYDVAELLTAMRDRYLHLTDPSRWPDDTREIAAHMAAGVKMSMDDLSSILKQRQMDATRPGTHESRPDLP